MIQLLYLASALMADRESRWLLLIHQIPPRPNYLRVKIGRRLQKIGAVAVKNSVYVLPNSDDAQEQFAWVGREIVEAGGDTSICESNFVGEKSNDAIEELFKEARARDFAELAIEAQKLDKTFRRRRRLGADERSDIVAGLGRLRRRLAEILQLDFFGAAGREKVEGVLGAIEARLAPPRREDPKQRSLRRPAMHRRIWVTRKGVHVDRIASAWLIRRFIDPEATFKFVPGKGYRPEPGELRFDMFEAEYTHEGDRCTFEVLLQRFALTDGALGPVGEVVHDIDIRDGKFGRPEVAGVERLITGVAAGNGDDQARIAAGSVLFDSLYEAFKRRKT
jgi:hypothetical protein